MENQILVNKTSKKILLYKVYEIHKKPPIGWFFYLLDYTTLSLIISYLRYRSPKNEKPIAFFVAQADFSLILVWFKVARELTK